MPNPAPCVARPGAGTGAERERAVIPIQIRSAGPADAAPMARMLNDIIRIGGTTAFRQPFDDAGIVDRFIASAFAISCFVAVDATTVVGFQSLEWSDPDWPGEDPLPADWALIATYVDPRVHKRRIGRQLFDRTAPAARQAGVRFIDATIRRENAGGLAYYRSLGFTDYRSGADTISKRFAPV